MGRVRRNQRDAIRKQRAKRRNRQSGGDESDSDCNQVAVVKRRRVDAEEKQAVSNQADFHSDFDANNTKRPSSSAQLDTTVSAVDRSESCKPDVDKPKEKAPVDRMLGGSGVSLTKDVSACLRNRKILIECNRVS
jgi:hypothetical protein